MGINYNPRIVNDGLVLAFDGGNIKSFKGTPATNLLYSLTNVNGEVNTTDFKTSYGNETAFIPSLGYKTVRYCNIYNNYPTSGNCCPSLFQYGGNVVSQNITVSPSTTYTYEIIYKTTSGYTNANYMYRYEYNSGAYVTEAGVHSEANRTSLGDGWYHAWGQFTTQATTNNLWLTGMWYYQYAVYDKVSVAAVSLHQGTYIIPPEHMLTPQENRGATVATGGGWADLIGNGNNGELVNGPTYSSANGGSIVFDGVDDRVQTSLQTYGNNTTWECWVNRTSSVNPYNMFMGRYLPYFGLQDGGIIFSNNISGSQQTFYSTGFTPSNNTWYHFTFTTQYDGTYTTSKIYINGVLNNSAVFTGSQGNYNYNFCIGDGNNAGSTWYPFSGKISNAKIYNKALSAAEISQNFNALRSRFSI